MRVQVKARVKAMRTAHVDPDKLYSPAEAAAILGVSRQTVVRELKSRRTPVLVIERPETLHKKSFRTIRIQGAVLIQMLNGMEKPL